MTIDLANFRKTLLKKQETVPSVHSIVSSMRSEFCPTTSTILNGIRRKRYPLIALNTQRSMGPARHILSQKIVAGTFSVDPPYKP